MKLFYSPMSPFARKVRVAAGELGLAERIELAAVDPWTQEDYRAVNPLGKVPAMTLDDGQTLFDSPVLCGYLNELGGGALAPGAGPGRWRSLGLEALADGVAEATVRRLVETRRAEGDRHLDVIDRQSKAMAAGLDRAEALAADFGDCFGLGEIALACALAYIDFRFPGEPWRTGRPRLAAWLAKVEQRPSMSATAPVQA